MFIFHKKDNSHHAFLSMMNCTACTDGLEQTTWLEFSTQGFGYPYYLCILEHAPAETRSYQNDKQLLTPRPH